MEVWFEKENIWTFQAHLIEPKPRGGAEHFGERDLGAEEKVR